MARGSKPGEYRGGRKKGTLNKVTRDVKALAQKHTPEALKTLAKIMASSESDAARVSAAKELLDRAHGKAPQPQTGEGGEGPVALALSWLQPSA